MTSNFTNFNKGEQKIEMRKWHSLKSIILIAFWLLSIIFLTPGPANAQDYPTASSFRMPILEDYKLGYDFLDGPIDYGCSGGDVYHPGVDLNVAGTNCDEDRGTRIYAVGNGIVRDVGNGSEWGSILIEHNHQGTIWYSQYGHMDPPYLVSIGDIVHKGQHIGYMGDVETNCVHLHFEIRKANHPKPTNAQAFCSILGGTPEETVKSWYENPIPFIDSHQCSYGAADSSVRWHPDGTLIREQGGIDVYLIHYGNYIEIMMKVSL